MFLIENVTVILKALLAGTICTSIFFLFCLFYRRMMRERYEQARRTAAERYAPPVDSCLGGALPVPDLVQVLKRPDSAAERDGIVDLLASRATPGSIERITEIQLATGQVTRWARAAFGKQGDELVAAARSGPIFPGRVRRSKILDFFRAMQIFALPRAAAVRHLGGLAPAFAHPFLVRAMADPSPRVRQAAIAAMGEARLAVAIPIVLETLIRSVEADNDLSIRDVKSAVVSFPMESLDGLLPGLKHQDPRVRFVVVDAIREICGKAAAQSHLRSNDFSPRLYRAFLNDLMRDSNADVRARSAEVIGHFHDDDSRQALARLMEDENEFVRLHAVRAARHYRELIEALTARVSDSFWRVREAAVNALAELTASGAADLYSFFLACDDRYASEQIADELQRGGRVPYLLAMAADRGLNRERALKACRKLAVLGKSSLLVSALPFLDAPDAQIEIMKILSAHPTPQFVTVLADLARSDPGPIREFATMLLQRVQVASLKTAVGWD